MSATALARSAGPAGGKYDQVVDAKLAMLHRISRLEGGFVIAFRGQQHILDAPRGFLYLRTGPQLAFGKKDGEYGLILRAVASSIRASLKFDVVGFEKGVGNRDHVDRFLGLLPDHLGVDAAIALNKRIEHAAKTDGQFPSFTGYVGREGAFQNDPAAYVWQSLWGEIIALHGKWGYVRERMSAQAAFHAGEDLYRLACQGLTLPSASSQD